jgi:hypothetical protein
LTYDTKGAYSLPDLATDADRLAKRLVSAAAYATEICNAASLAADTGLTDQAREKIKFGHRLLANAMTQADTIQQDLQAEMSRI